MPPQEQQSSEITFECIREAAERLNGHAHLTPIHHSTLFDAISGMETWFKCEQFQRTGSFKFRGAYNALAAMQQLSLANSQGVVAYSSGNHAQAIALSARLFNVPSIVFMPLDAPQVKVTAAKGYGADVLFYDRRKQDRMELAKQAAEERKYKLIPSSNDTMVIAGQGTVALELFSDLSDIDVIAAPVGGGGLIAGLCIATRALNPKVRIIGVETEGANHGFLSLNAGRQITVSDPDTVADGLRVNMLSELAWPIIRSMIDQIILVSEEEVFAAMNFLLFRMKLILEPTGAVAAAAGLSGKLQRYGKRAGIVLTGGNITPEMLSSLLVDAK